MTTALEVGERSAARPGRTLSPGIDLVPIVQEAGWAPGPVWTGGKSRLHRDLIPDRPACSQSLYQLSYLAHIYLYIYIYICCTGMYANCIKCIYTEFIVLHAKVSMYAISMDVHYIG